MLGRRVSLLFLLRQRRRGEKENDTRVGKESECLDHPSFILPHGLGDGMDELVFGVSRVDLSRLCSGSGLLAYGCRRFLFNVNDLASYEREPTIG